MVGGSCSCVPKGRIMSVKIVHVRKICCINHPCQPCCAHGRMNHMGGPRRIHFNQNEDFKQKDPKETVSPSSEHPEETDMAGSVGSPSREMANENLNSASCEDDEPGTGQRFHTQNEDSEETPSELSTSLLEEQEAEDTSGTHAGHSGNEASSQGDGIPHHGCHGSRCVPASRGLIVTHPVVHAYTEEYLWSPMLKYCRPEERPFRVLHFF